MKGRKVLSEMFGIPEDNEAAGNDEPEDEPNFSGIRKNLMTLTDFASTPMKGGGSSSNLELGQEHMKVYLRVRPLTEQETGKEENQGCLNVEDDHSVLTHAPRDSHYFKTSTYGLSKSMYRFTFSHIFNESTSQKEFFDGTMLEMVKDFVDGQNCLVYTYGITNAGKTYTIQGMPQDAGILPRALDVVFNSIDGKQWDDMNLKPQRFTGVVKLDSQQVADERRCKEDVMKMGNDEDIDVMTLLGADAGSDMSRLTNTTAGSEDSNMSHLSAFPGATESIDLPGVSDEFLEIENRVREDAAINVEMQGKIKFSVWISFAEIYNDQIFDLLERIPKKKSYRRTCLKLGEDKNGSPYIKGLKEINVSTADEAYKILTIGQRNLSKACTKLNHSSSRSHCIFTIKMLRVMDKANPQAARVSMLSLCDLAGSERYSKTHSTGDRLKEAGNINNSLHILSRCIETLRYNQTHKETTRLIPFRDSKLTRLFQNYFNGRGKAAMIVNVNQCASMFDETFHVFKFSAIANQVVLPKPEPKPLKRPCPSNLESEAEKTIRESITWEVPEKEMVIASSIPLPEEDDAMETDEEDTFAEDERINELIELVKSLEQKLKSSKREQVMKEVEVRREVTTEMMQQIVKIETMYTERLKEQEIRNEENEEKRINWLLASVKKPRKRAHDGCFEDDDDEWVSSVLLHSEQVKVQERDNKIALLEDEIKALKAVALPETSNEDPEIMQRFAVQLEEAKEALKLKEKVVQDFNEMLTEAGETFQQHTSQIEQLTNSVGECKDELQRKADTISSLKDLLTERDEKNAQLETEVSKLSQGVDYKDIEQQLDVRSKDLDNLRRKSDLLSQKIGLIETLKEELDERNEMIKEKDQTIADLQQNLRRTCNADAAASSTQSNVDPESTFNFETQESWIRRETELEEIVQSKTRDICRLDKRFKELTEKISADVASAEQMEKLRDELDEKLEDIVELNLQLSQAGGRVQELERCADEVNSKVSQVENELTQKQKEIEKLRLKLSHTKVNGVEIQKILTEITAEKEGLKLLADTVNKKSHDLEDLKGAIDASEQRENQLVVLQKGLMDREEDIERLEKMIKRKDEESSERQSKIDSAHSEREHDFEDRLLNKEKELRELKIVCDCKVQKLSSQVEVYEKKISNLEESLVKNEKELMDLRTVSESMQMNNCKTEKSVLEELLTMKDKEVSEHKKAYCESKQNVTHLQQLADKREKELNELYKSDSDNTAKSVEAIKRLEALLEQKESEFSQHCSSSQQKKIEAMEKMCHLEEVLEQKEAALKELDITYKKKINGYEEMMQEQDRKLSKLEADLKDAENQVLNIMTASPNGTSMLQGEIKQTSQFASRPMDKDTSSFEMLLRERDDQITRLEESLRQREQDLDRQLVCLKTAMKEKDEEVSRLQALLAEKEAELSIINKEQLSTLSSSEVIVEKIETSLSTNDGAANDGSEKLQQQLKSRHNELVNLQKSLETKNKELSNIKEKYARQDDDFSQRERALIHGYSTEVENLKAQIANLKRSHGVKKDNEVQKSLESYESVRKGNEKFKHDLMKQLKDLQMELDQKSSSIAETEQEMSIVKLATDDLESCLSTERMFHEKAKIQIDQLRAEIISLQKDRTEHERKLLEAENQLGDQKSDFENELKSKQADVDHVHKTKDKLVKDIHNLNDVLAKEKHSNSESVAEFESKIRSLEEFCGIKQSELEKINEMVEAKEMELTNVVKEKCDKAVELQQSIDTVEELEMTIASLRTMVDQVTIDNESKTSDVSKLVSVTKQNEQREKDILEKEKIIAEVNLRLKESTDGLESKTEEINSLEKQLSENVSLLDELKSVNERLEHNVSYIKHEMNECKEQLEQKEQLSETLSAELRETKTLLDDKEKLSLSADAETNSLKEKIIYLEQDIEKAETKVSLLNSEKIISESELSVVKEKLEKTEKEYVSEKLKLVEHLDERDCLLKNAQAENVELKKVADEVCDLNAKVGECRDELTIKETELFNLQTVMDELRLERKNSDSSNHDELGRTQAELSDVKMQVAELKSGFHMEQTLKQRAKEELQDVQALHGSVCTEMDTVQIQRDNLKQEVEQLKEKVEKHSDELEELSKTLKAKVGIINQLESERSDRMVKLSDLSEKLEHSTEEVQQFKFEKTNDVEKLSEKLIGKNEEIAKLQLKFNKADREVLKLTELLRKKSESSVSPDVDNLKRNIDSCQKDMHKAENNLKEEPILRESKDKQITTLINRVKQLEQELRQFVDKSSEDPGFEITSSRKLRREKIEAENARFEAESSYNNLKFEMQVLQARLKETESDSVNDVCNADTPNVMRRTKSARDGFFADRSYDTDNKTVMEENARLMKLVEEKDNNNRRLITELASSRDQVDDNKIKMETTNVRLQEVEKQLRQKEFLLKNMVAEQEAEEQLSRRTTMTSELDKSHVREQTLRSQLQQASVTLTEQSNSISDLERKLSTAEIDLDQSHRKLQRSETVEISQKTLVEKLRLEVSGLTQKLQDSESQVEKKDVKMKARYDQLGDLMRKRDEERMTFDLALKDAKANEMLIESLKNTLTEQEETMEAQDRLLGQKDDEIKAIEAELDKQNGIHSSLIKKEEKVDERLRHQSHQHAELETENNRLKQEVHSLQRDSAAEREKLSQSHRAELESLQNVAEKRTCEISKVNTDCDKMREDTNNVKQENERLKSECDSLRKDLRELRAEVDDRLTTGKRQRDERTRFEQTITENNAEMKELERLLSESRHEMEQLKTQNSQMQGTSDKHVSEAKQERELAMNELRIKMREKDKALRDLQKELEQLKMDMSKLSNQMKDTSGEKEKRIEIMQKASNDKEQEMKSWRENRDQIVGQLQTVMKNQEAENKQLRNETAGIEHLKNEMQSLTKDSLKKDEKIEYLQSQLTTLEQELATQSSSMKSRGRRSRQVSKLMPDEQLELEVVRKQLDTEREERQLVQKQLCTVQKAKDQIITDLKDANNELQMQVATLQGHPVRRQRKTSTTSHVSDASDVQNGIIEIDVTPTVAKNKKRGRKRRSAIILENQVPSQSIAENVSSRPTRSCRQKALIKIGEMARGSPDSPSSNKLDYDYASRRKSTRKTVSISRRETASAFVSASPILEVAETPPAKMPAVAENGKKHKHRLWNPEISAPFDCAPIIGTPEKDMHSVVKTRRRGKQSYV